MAWNFANDKLIIKDHVHKISIQIKSEHPQTPVYSQGKNRDMKSEPVTEVGLDLLSERSDARL